MQSVSRANLSIVLCILAIIGSLCGLPIRGEETAESNLSITKKPLSPLGSLEVHSKVCNIENGTFACTICFRVQHYEHEMEFCAKLSYDFKTKMLNICILQESTVLICQSYTINPSLQLCIPFFRKYNVKACLNLHNVYFDSLSFGACGYFELEYGVIHNKKVSLSCFHYKPIHGLDFIVPYLQKPVSIDDSLCLRAHGYDYAAVQIFRPTEGVIEKTLDTIIALASAGFKQIDVYHLPIIDTEDPEAGAAAKQIQQVFQFFDAKGFDYMKYIANYWVTITGTDTLNPSGWSVNDTNTNIKFLQAAGDELLLHGYYFGIHTTAPAEGATNVSWQRFFNNTNQFRHHFLWFDRYSNDLSFTSPELPIPFGGWKKGVVQKYRKNQLEECPGHQLLLDFLTAW